MKADNHNAKDTQNGKNSPTWDQIEGNWKQFQGKAREQWGKVTDDELTQIKGNREQLAGKIQEHYGKTREVAEREIDEFCYKCASTEARSAETPR